MCSAPTPARNVRTELVVPTVANPGVKAPFEYCGIGEIQENQDLPVRRKGALLQYFELFGVVVVEPRISRLHSKGRARCSNGQEVEGEGVFVEETLQPQSPCNVRGSDVPASPTFAMAPRFDIGLDRLRYGFSFSFWRHHGCIPCARTCEVTQKKLARCRRNSWGARRLGVRLAC